MTIEDLIYATVPNNTPFDLLCKQYGTQATKDLTQNEIKKSIYRDLERLAKL